MRLARRLVASGCRGLIFCLNHVLAVTSLATPGSWFFLCELHWRTHALRSTHGHACGCTHAAACTTRMTGLCSLGAVITDQGLGETTTRKTPCMHSRAAVATAVRMRTKRGVQMHAEREQHVPGQSGTIRRKQPAGATRVCPHSQAPRLQHRHTTESVPI